MAGKRLASVNQDVCVACGACGMVCPVGAISVDSGCYAQVDGEKCLGCGKCSKVCPTGCISIIGRDPE